MLEGTQVALSPSSALKQPFHGKVRIPLMIKQENKVNASLEVMQYIIHELLRI